MFGLESKAKPRYWTQAAKEVPVADFVTISAPLTDHDTITRDGDYLRAWELGGGLFETEDEQRANERHESLCNFINNLPQGRFAVYQYRLNLNTTDRLTDPVEPPFSAAFSKCYQDGITAKPLRKKRLFLVLLYRPYPSDMAKKMARGGRTLESITAMATEALDVMRDKTTLLERTLREFSPRLLGVTDDGIWESGTLFRYLITSIWKPVPRPKGPVWQTLPNARLTFGGNLVEIKTGTQRRYAAMLDIKQYADVEPGTLDGLLYEDCEYIETQSFSGLPRREAVAALQLQRNQLMAADDVTEVQIIEMDQAISDVGEGKYQMGEYHYSFAALGDSVEEVTQKAASAVGAVAETSAIEFVPIDLVSDAAWYAQQPGCVWKPRKAKISSRAFAALACGHSFDHGKRDGNPWGEALMMMRTPAGHAYYLNLHASPPNEESENKKLAGSTLLIGKTGSGKSAALCGMLAVTPKWSVPPRIVSFSLDRDTEILIRAMGGSCYSFERNVATGINPLQREVTPHRLAHWTALVGVCLESDGLPLLPSEREVIANAVHTVARMDIGDRWFSTIRQNLSRKGENSLFNRFSRWCRGGENGWVFDMAPDRFHDIQRHRAIAFDYTGIAESAEVKRPIMMELLDIMKNDLIDGTPLIYHVAEVWNALDDTVLFGPFIRYEQKTIRKNNGIGVFDTQQVEDLTGNENGRTVISQAVTKLVLPNAAASAADYVDGLGLTHPELAMVRSLGTTGARRILVKQGDAPAVVCGYDLSGLPDMLTVLSSTIETVELLDDIRAEVGDDPDLWLPILYSRARAMTRRIRKSA